MKVLLINKYYYLRDGTERVFLETEKMLKEHGHQVLIFAMKHEKNLDSKYSKYFIENINFQKKEGWLKNIKKAGHFLYSLEAKRKVRDLIKKEKPDIVHLHNFTHQLTVSILSVFKEFNIPVVQTLHDYQLICPNYRLYTQNKICERCKKHKYYQAVFHKCSQNSYLSSVLSCLDLTFQFWFKLYRQKIDSFISPSNFLKYKFKEWGVKNKINTLENSIDLDEYQPKYKVGSYLFFIGRLVPEKGILTLVKAVSKFPEIKLKIVGSGFLEKEIKQMKLPNVELLGPRYLEELYAIMRDSIFSIVPSEWYENYPMAVVESMALGKPVLVSNLGGLNEMVEENKTGWSFKAGDQESLEEKIISIIKDKELIEACGRRARKQVEEKNSSSVYYQKLIHVYKKLLEEGGRRNEKA